MGTAERRQREREQRSRQILAAAEKQFSRNGFEATTVQGIAREAEISIGTIYLYFRTKEELYGTLNLRALQGMDRALEPLVADREQSPAAKLQKGWGLLLREFVRSPEHVRALFHGQMQGIMRNLSPELLDQLNQTGRRLLHKLAAILRQGQEAGVFINENPIALADLLWATFTGVVTWEESKRITDSSKNHFNATVDLAFRCYLRGISK